MFANAKFSDDVIGIDEELAEVLEDLVKEGLGERIYSENKRPSIRSEEILRDRHYSIITGKKKLSKSHNQKKHSKDINSEKQVPVLPSTMHMFGEYGKKIIAVNEEMTWLY
ncbi:uncharacterized protein LOC122855084 [Aphidius gifuensis]|uniref:uncharacterized protein LOC122855084 n=1 Tax=Aphidius gifuensis TaxID=684658 RepID=UPI001CDD472F|nr:uncharacterized protein LOC122855084 [Aphidius gifuensis]